MRKPVRPLKQRLYTSGHVHEQIASLRFYIWQHRCCWANATKLWSKTSAEWWKERMRWAVMFRRLLFLPFIGLLSFQRNPCYVENLTSCAACHFESSRWRRRMLSPLRRRAHSCRIVCLRNNKRLLAREIRSRQSYRWKVEAFRRLAERSTLSDV